MTFPVGYLFCLGCKMCFSFVNKISHSQKQAFGDCYFSIWRVGKFSLMRQMGEMQFVDFIINVQKFPNVICRVECPIWWSKRKNEVHILFFFTSLSSTFPPPFYFCLSDIQFQMVKRIKQKGGTLCLKPSKICSRSKKNAFLFIVLKILITFWDFPKSSRNQTLIATKLCCWKVVFSRGRKKIWRYKECDEIESKEPE